MNFKDNDGIPYFNPTKDLAKWEKAATACKTAIAMCDSAGFKLYKYSPNSNDRINDELTVQMSIRNSVAENNFNLNKEVIWANTNNLSGHIQMLSTPTLDAKFTSNEGHRLVLAPPLNVAEMFYSSHGVPIEEDEEWVSTVIANCQVRANPTTYGCDRAGYGIGLLIFRIIPVAHREQDKLVIIL